MCAKGHYSEEVRSVNAPNLTSIRASSRKRPQGIFPDSSGKALVGTVDQPLGGRFYFIKRLLALTTSTSFFAGTTFSRPGEDILSEFVLTNTIIDNGEQLQRFLILGIHLNCFAEMTTRQFIPIESVVKRRQRKVRFWRRTNLQRSIGMN